MLFASIEQVLVVRVGTDECWHGQYLSDLWALSASCESNDAFKISQALKWGHGVERFCHPHGLLKDLVLVSSDATTVGGICWLLLPEFSLRAGFTTACGTEPLVAAERELFATFRACD